MVIDHPVFEAFQPIAVQPEPPLAVDSFLGTVYRPQWDEQRPVSRPSYPPTRDDEYFEWIALLQAAIEAQGTFTFIEAGAGYGRWSIRAAAAARARGLDFRLVSIEAEPTHCKWLRRTLLDNGIEPGGVVRWSAVAAESGMVKMQTGVGHWRPERWWGQGVDSSRGLIARFRRFKHRLSGIYTVSVPAVSLDHLLATLGSVDLIDFDIQGGEFAAIAHSKTLRDKVKRLHVGTHSAEVEAGLRAHLRSTGWACLYDYPCGQSSETPYGRIAFQDGVQVWV